MGEPYKKHNRHIVRPCPVCGGRVKVGQKNGQWWVYCSSGGFPNHIRQRFFDNAKEAIWFWNKQENKMANYDMIRQMSPYQMADYIVSIEADAMRRAGKPMTQEEIDKDLMECFVWLRQEVSK